ncbi:MAG: hypothetical protein ACEQSB_06055 [Undibacterium sp.]
MQANDQMREWTLVSGKKQQAEIVSYDEARKVVTLRLPNRSEFQVAEQKFSTIDRAWILQWVEQDEEAKSRLEKVGGTITEHRGVGKFSIPYFVYHPPVRSAAERLPMLILFHPGGNGRRGIYQHIESAAAVGITVVSLDYFRNTDDNSAEEEEMLARFGELLPQIEVIVPHDEKRIFMGGISGGAWRAYHYSAQIARPWAGILAYGGWLGGKEYGYLHYPRMRVAMVNGDKDAAANQYIEPDSSHLQADGSVVSVHAFEGGHQLAPPTVQEKALRWLVNDNPKQDSESELGIKSEFAMTPVAAALTVELDRFEQEVLQLFRKSNFAKLEEIANHARSTEARFDNGSWKIIKFYRSLLGNRKDADRNCDAKEKVYQEWIKDFPQSITARVAYADFMTDFAWKAWGSGSSSEVTPEGWKLFSDRLAKADTILAESKSLPSCPAWWGVRIQVAMGQNESPEDCKKLFHEAKALYPTNYKIDEQYYIYLLPRWHGTTGEWEAVAEREIERPDGLGFAAYAKVVMMMTSYYFNIFDEARISWEQTQKGCEQLCATYPDSKDLLNDYCHLAVLASDWPSANRLLDQIGEDVIPKIWGGINEFERLKAETRKNKAR